MFAREFTQLWLLLGVVVRYQIESVVCPPIDSMQATLTMSLLLLLSVSWIRIKFYEAFLIIHIGLSVVTLVGCFL